ncbi:hypothetical protein MP638_006037 [Amoeboaphelidium occidentale]|nr:hypothetical protein MP638_006037 [Amoeboaphelidium occidentale]
MKFNIIKLATAVLCLATAIAAVSLSARDNKISPQAVMSLISSSRSDPKPGTVDFYYYGLRGGCPGYGNPSINTYVLGECSRIHILDPDHEFVKYRCASNGDLLMETYDDQDCETFNSSSVLESRWSKNRCKVKFGIGRKTNWKC